MNYTPPGLISNKATNPSEYTTVEGRPFVALLLSFLSLGGLVFPPAIGLGIAGVVLSWKAHTRIAASGGTLKGRAVVWIALVLGVIGCLLSLAIPGFVAYVYLYAAFHGGQAPFNDLP